MKLSEKLNLDKNQYQLDFVDIDIDKDIPLFIDPIYISKANTPMINRMYMTLNNFFSYLMDLLEEGRVYDARKIFLNLNEVNDIHLGLSKNESRGNGIGIKFQEKIFDNIVDISQRHESLLNQIQDIKIFVKGIDRDRISDMIANIIRKNLIEYTKYQCELNNIEMTKNVQTGFYWNPDTKSWENTLDDMLVIDGKKIILVPRLIVSYADQYTSGKFIQHFALNFLQEQHLINKSSLVQTYTNKDGKERIWVTKKSIMKNEKEKNGSLDKEWVANFVDKNPKVFDDFNEANKKQCIDSCINTNEIEKSDVAMYLNKKLKEIPSGRENAGRYHDLIIGILEFLFYPNLANPRKETPIHEKRKRIDITFENSAEKGFFYNLPTIHQVASSLIMIECKNYENDPGNPEIDQLSGRFSINRGMFGLLLIRNVNKEENLLKRCQDIRIDKNEIIIYLTDDDLHEALNYEINGIGKNIEKIISDKFFEVKTR